MSAYEKSPFEFGGYSELRWEHIRFDKDNTLYLLNYFNQNQPNVNNKYVASLQLEGRYSKNQFTAYARINPEVYTDDFTNDSELNTHEAYITWQAKPGAAFDVGKKLVKWGKGYAWNPVGFIERPKDPNDPDLAREGFTIVGADWIFSNVGTFQTISITPVFLPVRDDFNRDFGANDNNVAGKVYFLYKDTDIDFMFLSNGSRTSRYGFDASRNISTNFEVHGEWAYINNFKKNLLNQAGNLQINVEDVQSWLLGIRYLTESDTTYIVEYYHNDTGLEEEQIKLFYQLVEDVPNQIDTDLAIREARSLAKSGYVTQTVMQDYLYVRVTQKEPFGILYVTPSVTSIVNIQDQSYNFSPEVAYTGFTNLELRLKMNFLKGNKYSEFGEKQNDLKVEFKARYYF